MVSRCCRHHPSVCDQKCEAAGCAALLVSLLVCQLAPLCGTFREIIDCAAAPPNSSVMAWSGSPQEPGGPPTPTPECLRQEGEGAALEAFRTGLLAAVGLLPGTRLVILRNST